MRWLQTDGPAPVSPAPILHPSWCAACRHYGHPMTSIRIDGFDQPVSVCEHPTACRQRAETAGIYKSPEGNA